MLPAVQEIVNDLETEADNKITKAEEAGDRKEVSRLKEELKCIQPLWIEIQRLRESIEC